MANKILIVEDEPDIQEIERMVAEDLLNCQVELAATGEEALEKAAANPPDLLVLDLMLPGIDGFTVASRFREDPRLRRTCILALSGLTRQEDRDKAYASGCNDVLDKPFDLDELTRRIRGLLATCVAG